MKITSQNRPATVHTSLNRCHQQLHTVNFDVEYNQRTKEYEFESIEIAPGDWNRAAVIDAIVRSRYSQSAMEAVINNYLADSIDATAIDEMNAMQAWRRHAKEIAGGLSYE